VERLGERIRKRREQLEIAMNVMAKGVGITPSMLSQIENGKAFPSLHNIKHIAEYLNTSVGALIGEMDLESQSPVIRWEDKKLIKSNDQGASMYLLSHYHSIHMAEMYLIELEKNGNTADLFDNNRNALEFCFVVDGEIDILLQDHSYRMRNKDSIYFYSSELKEIQNKHKNSTHILWNISIINKH